MASNPIIINKIPNKITPSNPALSILTGKLDGEGKIEIDDAVDLALVKVQEALNGGSGTGDLTGAESVGSSGLSIYKTKSGSLLQFKKVTGSTQGITITEANDIITVSLDKTGANLNNVDNTSDSQKVASGPIKSALDTKPTLTSGKVDISVIPTAVVQVDGTGKIPLALIPEGVNPSEVIFYTASAGTSPVGTIPTGADGKIYVNRTDNHQWRWDTTNTSYIDMTPTGTGGSVSITNAAGTTTTGSSFTINKSFVGLGNADNTSDVNKPISSATQTALNGKLANDSTTLDTTVRGRIGAVTGNAQFTYNSSTGLFTSTFNDSLKTAYDDANSKKHVHTDITALNNITQAKLNDYSTVRVKAEIVDLTPTILTTFTDLTETVDGASITVRQYKWTYNPLKPNVFLVVGGHSRLIPQDLMNGAYGNVETIQDGTGNWKVLFAGVAPATDDYPVMVGTTPQTQAYAKYNFSWFRNYVDLMWDSTHCGIGSSVAFTGTPSSLTHVDNTNDITLNWGTGTNATKYFLQRRTYITASKPSSWYYIWTPGNLDTNKLAQSYVDSDVEKGVKYEYRVQAINQANTTYPSDWKVIAAPITKS